MHIFCLPIHSLISSFPDTTSFFISSWKTCSAAINYKSNCYGEKKIMHVTPGLKTSWSINQLAKVKHVNSSFSSSGFNFLSNQTEQTEIQSNSESDQRSPYSVLHSIGSDEIGVVVAGIGNHRIGEEADADVPFDDGMASIFAPPNPSHPHPLLAMPLVEVEALYFVWHDDVPEKTQSSFSDFLSFKQLKISDQRKNKIVDDSLKKKIVFFLQPNVSCVLLQSLI